MKRISIILFFALVGCASPEILSRERTVRDSVIFREVEKEVLIPAFKAQSNSINIDSLAKLLRSGASREVIERTLVREDPETRIKVGILIDSLGNLMAVCEAQDRMIKILIEEREILRTDFERIVLREKENIFEELYGGLKNIGLILLFIIIVGVAIKLLK